MTGDFTHQELLDLIYIAVRPGSCVCLCAHNDVVVVRFSAPSPAVLFFARHATTKNVLLFALGKEIVRETVTRMASTVHITGKNLCRLYI